jgi:hypothetical protein
MMSKCIFTTIPAQLVEHGQTCQWKSPEEGWQNGKLRHVKTSFQFVPEIVRGRVKMQDIALHPA